MASGGVIKALQQEGLSCVQCQRWALDETTYSRADDHSALDGGRPFETPQNAPLRVLDDPPVRSSILRFFVDGSRRTYKVSQVESEGRWLPMLAAQIGVAVLERSSGSRQFAPVKDHCHFDYLLAVPRTIESSDIAHYQSVLDRTTSVRLGTRLRLVQYSAPRDKEPQDAATQKIMEELRDQELRTVQDMARGGLLREGSMLVRDGPLEFQMQLDPAAFRNVIGVSKTFDTAQPVGRGTGKKDVGCMAADLDFRCRTRAYRAEYGGNTVAHWYVRIHHREHMPNPLDGVVKVSRLACDASEKENGLPHDLVDHLSQHLVRERNVTPYGADRRWANHLYPIYLTEAYLKSRFLSDLAFNGVF